MYSSKEDLNGEVDNVRLRGASYDGTGYVVDLDVNGMTAGNWTAEIERLRVCGGRGPARRAPTHARRVRTGLAVD